MVLRIVLIICLILSSLFTVSAQQSSPPPPTQQNPPQIDSQDVVRITSNLVQIDAVVTKDGKVVTDLQPEDFEILEDGKLQAITNFSYISNVPAGTMAADSSRSRDKTAPPVPPAKINLNDQHRVVALVVDDLGISWETMAQVRKQAQKFVGDAAPNDLIAIIRTGGDIGTLQQFTNDKRVLQAAVEHLRWNPCSRAGMNVFSPNGDMGTSFGLCTEFTGSGPNHSLKSLEVIIQGMRNIPGRKSLILLSDNLPIQNELPSATAQAQDALGSVKNSPTNPSDESGVSPGIGSAADSNNYYALRRVAELAIRASIVIYAVDTRGFQTLAVTPADRVTLTTQNKNQLPSQIMTSRMRQMWSLREGSDLIARQTGGFLIYNTNDFDLKRIMNDQQGYYLIGFRPAEETFNRNFHHVRIRVKRRGFTVRTREGFYGFTDADARRVQLTATDEINKALSSPFAAHDINVRLTSFFMDDPKQGPIVRSLLYLDPRDLTFTEAEGWHSTNLTIKATAFGDNGRIIASQDRTGLMRFRGPDYDRARREGIVYTVDVPMHAPGAFQFRVAVRDENTARLGSAGHFVQVPDLHKGELTLSGIVARELAPEAALGTEPIAVGPALRQFHQGTTVGFGFLIYNPNLTGQPNQLTAQLRLIRDAMIVFTGPAVHLNFNGQTDRQRAANLIKLDLGSDLIPGDYVCQIIVTDGHKQTPRTATQWIDFEVVK